jgi:hypothetical protein
MSRRELLDDFLDYVVESGDATARSTAERLYNRALMTIWRKHPWRQFYMPQPIQLVTVAGQRSYVLPKHFGRVAGGKIRNITRSYDIVGMEAEMLQTLHPEQGTSEEDAGKPDIYTVSGTCGVEVLLATAVPIEVVSNVANDGPNAAWTVEGFDAAGIWRRVTGVFGGLAAVDVGTMIPWMFSKAYVESFVPPTPLTSSMGTATLRLKFAPGDLAHLSPYESAVEHQIITFYPVPESDGDVIAVPFLRRPVRSLYDADVVPMDFSEAIFEEMVIQWRVNQGEMATDQAGTALRPKFLDLLSYENSNRMGYPHRTRPFYG